MSGTNYLFVEFLPGKVPYSDEVELGVCPISQGGIDPSIALPLFESFAAFEIGVSKIEFDKIGSVYADCPSTPLQDMTFHVGPLVDKNGFNRPDPPYFYGPFANLRDRFVTECEHVIEAGLKGWFRDIPVTMILAHLEIRALVQGDKEFEQTAGPTYVTHWDGHLGQFLLDDEGALSGILDWEQCVRSLGSAS